MSKPPDFRDLVGEDLSPEERARLERVHDMLITAGRSDGTICSSGGSSGGGPAEMSMS